MVYNILFFKPRKCIFMWYYIACNKYRLYIIKFWHYHLLSLCSQTSELSIRYDLISTCPGKCDWLFHWQHKLCATFSTSVNINYRLPIKVYYRIYTQNRNKSWKPECVLSFNMDWRILVNFIPRFWLGIKY